MKRAALIITDAEKVYVAAAWVKDYEPTRQVDTSEQLLADLQTLVAPWNASVDVLVAARANVRSLLPRR